VPRRWLAGVLAAAACVAAARAGEPAAREDPAAGNPLSEVVVSAGRAEQNAFEVPASIQSVGAETIGQAGPRVNLSESLSRIPGVTVLNRSNYAQDLQLSIRGFGGRSTFGIRGVRLLADGIPATMPDGQGQAATIALPAASRIEVLRGPLTVLYGNAAGGVVQSFSADGAPTPELTGEYLLGGFDTWRAGLRAGGQDGASNYVADWSRFATGGWREHGSARREQLAAKWRFDPAPGTRVTLVGNAFDQPLALDPLGLTRSQLAADPRQAAPEAIEQNARKTVSQDQLGVLAEHRLDAARTIRARVYLGQRDVFQALATPLRFQLAPTSAGGIVDLDRSFGGASLQFAATTRLGDAVLEATLGADYDRQRERRRGYVNRAGTQGELRRDELNTVYNADLYALANLALPGGWTITAGARSSTVSFASQDHYVTAGNGDDSGSVRYGATSPVLGVSRLVGEHLNLYANWGRGFETPTFAEIAYRSTTGSLTGLNLALSPSTSTHAEVGAKLRLGAHRLDLAAFAIDTRDEIVVDENAGGRATFRNAGRTRRDGFEIAYSASLAAGLSARVALTWLDARYTEGFASGSGAAAVTVAAGNRLPGTSPRMVFAELVWRPRGEAVPSGLQLAAEVQHVGRLYVDDANSDSADAWTVVNLRAGLAQRAGAWRFAQLLRVDNLGGRRYVGSVIVNESNRRYFESAPTRAWMAGASATLAF
jgi:iron complex outermembrane receptor protein